MSECNLILSSILPDSTTITSIRACINYCANPTINPTASYQAGITAISRTDPSPACYCFQVDRVILFGQDPSYCTPCPDDSSYRCGGFVGPVPPRTTDMKSIVLYSAIFQPFPVNDPPPPSPPPPSPPPPSPAPIVSSPVSVEPGFTTENVITPSATDSTLPDAIAPLATTTIITGTDGSVTARTLNPPPASTIFLTLPISNSTFLTTTSPQPLTSSLPIPSSPSSSPNVAILAGGISAVLTAVIGISLLLLYRHRSLRKHVSEHKPTPPPTLSIPITPHIPSPQPVPMERGQTSRTFVSSYAWHADTAIHDDTKLEGDGKEDGDFDPQMTVFPTEKVERGEKGVDDAPPVYSR